MASFIIYVILVTLVTYITYKKGRNAFLWFFFGLIFPWLVFIVPFLEPDWEELRRRMMRNIPEGLIIDHENKKCLFCGNIVSNETLVCPNCNKKLW